MDIAKERVVIRIAPRLPQVARRQCAIQLANVREFQPVEIIQADACLDMQRRPGGG